MPRHSAFYEGFFKQLGRQVNSQVYVALSPDHQNTLLGMLAGVNMDWIKDSFWQHLTQTWSFGKSLKDSRFCKRRKLKER